jgi:hypothetical protein
MDKHPNNEQTSRDTGKEMEKQAGWQASRQAEGQTMPFLN